jgi:hypothetical protein
MKIFKHTLLKQIQYPLSGSNATGIRSDVELAN